MGVLIDHGIQKGYMQYCIYKGGRMNMNEMQNKRVDKVPDLVPLYQEFYDQYQMDCRHNMIFVDAGTGQGKTYSFLWFAEAMLQNRLQHKIKHLENKEILKDYKIFYLYPKKLDAPINDILNGPFEKLRENYVVLYSHLDALKECWGKNMRTKSIMEMTQNADKMIVPFRRFCEKNGGEEILSNTSFFKAYSKCVEHYYKDVWIYDECDTKSGERNEKYLQQGRQKIIDELKARFQKHHYRPMVKELKKLLRQLAKKNEWGEYSLLYRDAKTFGALRRLFPAMEIYNPECKVFFMTTAKALRMIDPIIAPPFPLHLIRSQFPSMPLIHLFIDEVDEFIKDYNKMRYEDARENPYGLIELAQHLVTIHNKRLSRLGRGIHGKLQGKDKKQWEQIKEYNEQIDSKIEFILKKYPYLLEDFKFESDDPNFVYLAIFGYPLSRFPLSRKESGNMEYIIPYEGIAEDGWAPHNRILSCEKGKEDSLPNNAVKLRDFVHDISVFIRSMISKLAQITRIYHELINKEDARGATFIAQDIDKDLSAYRELNLINCSSTVLNEFGLSDSNIEENADPYINLVMRELQRDTLGYRKDSRYLFVSSIYSFFNRGYHMVWPKQAYSHYQKDDVSSCDCVSSCENFFLNLSLPSKQQMEANKNNKLMKKEVGSEVLIYGLSATSHYDTILTNLNYQYLEDIGEDLIYQPTEEICHQIRQKFDNKNRFMTKGQEVKISCYVADEYLINIPDKEIKAELYEKLHYSSPEDFCNALKKIGIEDAVSQAQKFYEELDILMAQDQNSNFNDYRIRQFCIFLECFQQFMKKGIRSLLFFNTASLYDYQGFLTRAALACALMDGFIRTQEDYCNYEMILCFFKTGHFRDDRVEYEINEKKLMPVLRRLADGGRAFIVTSYASAGRSFNPVYPAPFKDMVDGKIHCIGDDSDVMEFRRKQQQILNKGEKAYKSLINRWFERKASADELIMIDFQSCYIGTPSHVFPYPDKKERKTILPNVPEEFIQGVDYLYRLWDYKEISWKIFRTGLSSLLMAVKDSEKDTLMYDYRWKPKEFLSTQISALQTVSQAIGRMTRRKYRYSEGVIFVQKKLLEYPWQLVYSSSQLNRNHYIEIILAEAEERGVKSELTYNEYKKILAQHHLMEKSEFFGKHLSEIAEHLGEESDSYTDNLAMTKFDDLHTYCLYGTAGRDDTTDFVYPSMKGEKERNVFFLSLTGKPINKRFYKLEKNIGRYVRITDVSDEPQGNEWCESSADALQLPLYDQCIEFHNAFEQLNIPIEWKPQLYFPLPSFFEQVYKGRIGEVIQDVFLEKYLGYTAESLSGNIYEVFDRMIKEAPGIYFDAKFMTESSFMNYVESQNGISHFIQKIRKIIARGRDIQGVVIINTRILTERDNTSILQPKRYFVQHNNRQIPILQVPQLLNPMLSKHLTDNIPLEVKHEIVSFIADVTGGVYYAKN